MYAFTDIEKITPLATKVNITLSNNTLRMSDQKAVADLMIKAVLMGASPNCIKQLGVELSDRDFEIVKEAREALSKAARIIEQIDLSSINVVKHRFH